MPETSDQPTPGSARREGRGFISSFGAGRRCAEPTCTTLLSRYNEKSHCAVHDPGSSRPAV